MKSRIHARKKSTREQTPDFSTAPAQPMFQSRSFVVQSRKAEQSQQPDLKTALQRAERYGHHVSRMQLAGVSAATEEKNKEGRGEERITQEKNKVGEQVGGTEGLVQRMEGNGEEQQALPPDQWGIMESGEPDMTLTDEGVKWGHPSTLGEFRWEGGANLHVHIKPGSRKVYRAHTRGGTFTNVVICNSPQKPYSVAEWRGYMQENHRMILKKCMDMVPV